MSENLEQSAGELPAAGDTSTPERTGAVDLSGSVLTIAEAVERYDVSRATLRRRLEEGALQGAHKVPGPQGETWAIPAAALVALGYVHRTTEPSTPAEPAPPAVAPAELLAVVDRLTTLLEGERAQLMAAENDRADARAQAAAAAARAELLTAELERERARVAELEAQVLARPRRRWRR